VVRSTPVVGAAEARRIDVRYAPDQIRVTVREDHARGRLLVSWRGAAFLEVRDAFRERFPTHHNVQ
jgi:hypothetical protein